MAVDDFESIFALRQHLSKMANEISQNLATLQDLRTFLGIGIYTNAMLVCK